MNFDALIAKTPKALSELVKKDGKYPISYSQFSLFASCPFAWKCKYVDKIKDDSYSIHLLFGSAMHTVIQEYLIAFYNHGSAVADAINFNTRLLEEMTNEFQKAIAQLPQSLQDFTSQGEMIDFYKQGIEILYFIRSNRSDYFQKKGWELVGVEVPLITEVDSNDGVAIIGFLDIVLHNVITKRYKIIDLKTSTRGWSSKDKSNLIKSSQLILYKKYYAKQFGLTTDIIDIEFLILRRMTFDGAAFPQKRVQRHCPASGKPTMNKIEKLLSEFVSIFDSKGLVKSDVEFKKTPGSPCKYCFYGEYNICDKNKTK